MHVQALISHIVIRKSIGNLWAVSMKILESIEVCVKTNLINEIYLTSTFYELTNCLVVDPSC
jgi:hypothetical protein